VALTLIPSWRRPERFNRCRLYFHATSHRGDAPHETPPDWLIDGFGGEGLPVIDPAFAGAGSCACGKQAARRITWRRCRPDGSTVCVLILRLNSSSSRSMALAVRTLRHWLGGKRVKVKSRSQASSRLRRLDV
jgi:hypothetical protein